MVRRAIELDNSLALVRWGPVDNRVCAAVAGLPPLRSPYEFSTCRTFEWNSRWYRT
jgi:hypothetical protein